MLRCNLLTVCSGSSLDQTTNQYTLFNIIEQFEVVAPSGYNEHANIPSEVLSYWTNAEEDIGQQHQIRFVLVSALDGTEVFTDEFTFIPRVSRFRGRASGIPLPKSSGRHALCVEWRHATSEKWTRESVSWPLDIKLVD